MRTLFFIFLVSSVLLSLQARGDGAPALSPSLYIYGLYGTSSAEHPEEFAPGGHDPSRKDAWVLQAAEPSLSLRWGNHVQGFVNGLAFTDEKDDLEWEWEEYFLKAADLPGGLELRGGRFLNRVGFSNPTHLHSWSTVDAPLTQSLFLGDDGLSTNGGEINFYWNRRHPTVFTLSYGKRPSHAHDHAHEEEDAEHDGHDDDHEEGFGGLEALRVQDDVFTLGLRRDQILNDFTTVRLTAFGGWGENEQGADSAFAGAGVELAWREHGLEPGGRAAAWRTEVIYFDADAADEDAHEDHDEHEDEHDEEAPGNGSAWGLTTQVMLEAHPRAHPFARIDWIPASDDLELPEWIRYSLGVTVPLNQDPGMFIRLQGNADEQGENSEQSVWAQLGFSWGGGEVR